MYLNYEDCVSEKVDIQHQDFAVRNHEAHIISVSFVCSLIFQKESGFSRLLKQCIIKDVEFDEVFAEIPAHFS